MEHFCCFTNFFSLKLYIMAPKIITMHQVLMFLNYSGQVWQINLGKKKEVETEGIVARAPGIALTFDWLTTDHLVSGESTLLQVTGCGLMHPSM